MVGREMNLEIDSSRKWKEDNVSYRRMHNWVRKYLSRPDPFICQICGNAPAREVACIKEYTRKLPLEDNWKWTCHLCNMADSKSKERMRERRSERPMEIRNKNVGKLVPCACGCKNLISNRDKYGHIIRFIRGHFFNWYRKVNHIQKKGD